MYCEILQDWNFLDFVITVVDEIVLNLSVRDKVYKQRSNCQITIDLSNLVCIMSIVPDY